LYITKINNIFGKNFFSIVIVNNHKSKEENIINSNSKKMPKSQFEIGLFKIH
jgi:hypothetical protein